jgi:menaquinone-dependent protoporphyrinogen oxidase
MTGNVLVAYGTTNGSTAQIAEAVAAVLSKEGFTSEALPAGSVSRVTPYDAVVVGGGLYAGRWHKDARRFLRRHGRELAGRPVWLFSSGPLDNSADTKDIPPVPQAARAVSELAARQHVTFGGQLTDTAKGFIAKAMVRNGHGGDFRNTDRIEAWSRTIAAALR